MDLFCSGLRWAMLLAPVVLSFAQPAHAAGAYIVTETVDFDYTDEEEPRLAAPAAASMGDFGPFRVVANDRAELIDGTDSDTPRLFKALLTAHPGLRRIDMIDCPGSEDDDANLELARMIRAAGVEMRVPSGGSIRSGAVELFLAGTRRVAEAGAEIAVHAWKDSDGFEATDYPPNSDVHMPYLRFYRDMGMAADTARAFYDFTNHVAPFDGLHVMTNAELRRFGLITAS